MGVHHRVYTLYGYIYKALIDHHTILKTTQHIMQTMQAWTKTMLNTTQHEHDIKKCSAPQNTGSRDETGRVKVPP